ncbi:unnamed protein product [Mytilus coruscus]|uniref:Reverse transcriptase/retrotransposon-derived protein RNase H-like domain-containing protein n=1 Tax=Mytilus coruscus TaxID=42192 RepID=A0A6J8B3W2_MYTCO|nr:unnamed protein product [Mytilus coruscus]
MIERFICPGLRPEYVVPFATATGLKQKYTKSEAIDAVLLADMTIQTTSKSEPAKVTSAIKDKPDPQNPTRSDGKHIIDTGEANPVRQFPYQTTPKTKEEINLHLDEMEEQGFIRKNLSPWSRPILLVAKPNGEKKVSVDYRKLNRLTKIYTQSLPHLSDVLDTLGENSIIYKLKVKPSKCQFACKEVQYLGHIITKEGIAVDPEKTASVQSFAAPKNVKEVRMFLGLCTYNRKFIHNYSKITSALNQILHKDQPFQWIEDCQHSLETLKTKLTPAVILVFQDFN